MEARQGVGVQVSEATCKCLSWARVSAGPPVCPLGGRPPGQTRLLGLRVLNHWPALVRPSAGAALSEGNVFCPLFPGYTPDGHV